MGDYYYDRTASRQSDRTPFGLVADFVLMLLSVLTAAALLAAYVAPYVHPAGNRILPLLGLVAPGLYVIALLLVLVWIIRWRWMQASAMIVVAALGLFRLPLYYNVQFRRDNPKADSIRMRDRSAFTVMTFNVRSLYGDDHQTSVEALCDILEESDPDIICMQEFRASAVKGRFADLLAEYQTAQYGDNDKLYHAQVILSKPRFRMLRSGALLSDSLGNPDYNAVWADLLIRNDTVRIFNNHLRSTSITSEDDDFLTKYRYLSDSASETKLRSIAGRFGRTSADRALQVDSITAKMCEVPYQRIVCGDFNDTPMSYVYRRMARGLKDAFSEAGKGFSSTYRGFNRLLRIDFILLSEGFETVGYETVDTDISDHLPVVVRMKYNGKPN